jgi:HD-GYP domain-containing protein (c-di-GMP phosphodiesterase class II)
VIKKNINDLPLWAVLGQDVFTLQGQLLLLKGTVIKPDMVNKLIASGITEVYVEGKEESPRASVRKKPGSNLHRAFLVGQIIVGDMIDQVRSGRPIERGDLEEAVNILYPEVLHASSMFTQLWALRRKDEYTMQHSIAVGAFGVKICQLLRLPQKIAKQVGMAGMMHDIGKVRIPDTVLNKPGALNYLEWEQMKRHPRYGYEILKSGGDVEREIQLAVLQHHERLDSGGYPLNSPSEKIHLFSRILAIADSFDAMTSERVYRKPLSVFVAAEELMSDAFKGKLDARIVLLFVNYILDMSPGQRVILNTGQIAEVILPNKSEPTRPLVKADSDFINLELRRDVWIEDFVRI